MGFNDIQVVLMSHLAGNRAGREGYHHDNRMNGIGFFQLMAEKERAGTELEDQDANHPE